MGDQHNFRVNDKWTDRETLLNYVRCPIVVGEGRTFLKRQVGHLGGLDDERVQESEERERKPRSGLLWIRLNRGILVSY